MPQNSTPEPRTADTMVADIFIHAAAARASRNAR